MRGLLFALFGSAVLTAASCSVYDSSLYQSNAASSNGGHSGGGSGNGGDGGSGARDGGGGPNSGGGQNYCQGAPRAIYPDAPTENANPTKSIEIVAAQYQIDLGDATPNPANPPKHYLEVGFDLDNTCTTADNPRKGTCSLPDFATGVIDGKGGIDSALGSLIQNVRNQIGDFSSGNYSKAIQDGKSNVLLHVENWNGEANDRSVIVSTLVAAPFDSFNAGAKPKWDGTDAFPVASDTVNGSVKSPKFVDTHAYVSNYQVVATLAKANLRLDVGLTSVQDVKLDMQLSSAFVVCTIVPVEEGTWGYTFSKCTLGGRWQADDLVHQLGQFPNPLDNNRPLCRGNSSYDAFKKGICSQVDTNQSSTAGPTELCDSLSIGVAYTMKPVLLGDLYPLKPIADPCPANEAQNPKYDCCGAIDVPDAGRLAACGFADAGAPTGTGGASTGGRTGSGGAGTGGRGSGGATTGGASNSGGAQNTGGGGTDGGGGRDASTD